MSIDGADPPCDPFRMRVFMLRGCPFAHRATIALREKNVPFEPVFFEAGKRPLELETIGPHAKSPTLFDDQTVVWDSQIALEYIDEKYPDPPLIPRDPGERARVRMMATRIDRDLTSKQGPLIVELFQKPKDQRDEKKIADAKNAFRDALIPFDALLRDREWLVGDALSMADITLYTPILGAQRMAQIEVPPELTHLGAWLVRMSKRPACALVT